jgi:hypothetical protein
MLTFSQKPEGKRPLGGHRCGQENNIKMDLKEICLESVHLFIRLEEGTVGGLF